MFWFSLLVNECKPVFRFKKSSKKPKFGPNVGFHSFFFLSRFTISLMFYAVSYNSVYLGGNIYISFFVTNVILIPANGLAVVAMKK